MSGSTCATVIIFLIISAAVAGGASTTSGLQELEVVKMVQAEIGRARDWVNDYGPHGLELDRVRGVGVSECDKLYEESAWRVAMLVGDENYTRDDARAWLSGVVANHRTCLDGLGVDIEVEFEVKVKGHSHEYDVPQNLTSMLSQALALYARGGQHNDRKDACIGVPRGSIRDDINEGILASWTPAISKADFVVAKDGSGTHSTINGAVLALDRLGEGRSGRVIIYVKSGVYNEKVEIKRHMRNVMFVGDGMGRTIVTGSKNVPDGSTTLSSATFGVSADGFWARDMTFENTAGPRKHQAVALMVSSDHSIFYRCSFRAYQDTLFVHSLRQFYRDCHIYGTIDFIFGDASAVFQNCDILVRRPMDHQANMITAQGRDDLNENTGISIQMSRIRPARDFVAVKNSFKTYLGRPWRKYSRTVFLRSDIDGLIDPVGWREWSGNFALSTLYYGEYMNMGDGASTARRVRWPGFHVLRRPEEARPFTASALIQGEQWIPGTGVPFQAVV